MSQSGLRLAVRTTLLAATCLTATPVLAQKASVEDRPDRLDAQQGATQQQTAAIEAEQAAMRETA
ncbi:MAG: hypothetical protein AAFZ11_11815 [Pseudomonadota bacterium]